MLGLLVREPAARRTQADEHVWRSTCAPHVEPVYGGPSPSITHQAVAFFLKVAVLKIVQIGIQSTHG